MSLKPSKAFRGFLVFAVSLQFSGTPNFSKNTLGTSLWTYTLYLA